MSDLNQSVGDFLKNLGVDVNNFHSDPDFLVRLMGGATKPKAQQSLIDQYLAKLTSFDHPKFKFLDVKKVNDCITFDVENSLTVADMIPVWGSGLVTYQVPSNSEETSKNLTITVNASDKQSYGYLNFPTESKFMIEMVNKVLKIELPLIPKHNSVRLIVNYYGAVYKCQLFIKEN